MNANIRPKKSLGQHWLEAGAALDAMVKAGEVSPEDTVVEVGPGLGTLTQKLIKRARKVIAIELDEELAHELKTRVEAKNLLIEQKNILEYDFSEIAAGYKVVANIPYYLTSHLVRMFLEAPNRPKVMALLVQKEVAERMVAQAGEMNLLAISVQFYATCSLKMVVPRQLFRPPPKVDSQIIQIKLRRQPLFDDIEPAQFFRLVKAGFSEKRKKLRSSLSGGLHLDKTNIDELLKSCGINSDARAQELSLDDWHGLALKIDGFLK
jgi:16S rRNA (adenine1518-N6/adenine1519-N6)-dimethyltransferase